MTTTGSNGYDEKRVTECVGRIESLLEKKQKRHMEYMADCAVINEDIGSVYTEAKDAWGIPKRPLKAAVKVRALHRKIDDMRDSMEVDDQDSYDNIVLALGMLADTPLGGAVLSTAASDGDEEDLRTPAQKRRESERKQRNAALDAVSAEPSNGAEKLATGITRLN